MKKINTFSQTNVVPISAALAPSNPGSSHIRFASSVKRQVPFLNLHRFTPSERGVGRRMSVMGSKNDIQWLGRHLSLLNHHLACHRAPPRQKAVFSDNNYGLNIPRRSLVNSLGEPQFRCKKLTAVLSARWRPGCVSPAACVCFVSAVGGGREGRENSCRDGGAPEIGLRRRTVLLVMCEFLYNITSRTFRRFSHPQAFICYFESNSTVRVQLKQTKTKTGAPRLPHSDMLDSHFRTIYDA